MENKIWAAVLAGGGYVYGMWGGLGAHLQLLLVLMLLDIVSGLALAAHPTLAPKKGESGKIESHVMFKGLVKKGMALAIIGIGYLLDNALGMSIIGDGCILAFVLHELISVTENAARIGVPIPNVIKKAMGGLSDKEKGAG